MKPDNTTDPRDAVYQLEDDVYISYDKTAECSRILKLNDDDFFYQANLVAGEIVIKINGKDSIAEIVKSVASSYDSKHFQEILSGAIALMTTLLEKKLIKKVK
jgi:hypothetical protein